MRFEKTAMWLSLAIVITAAAAASAAGPRDDGEWDGWGAADHPRMERFREHRLERLTAFLDLTDQQLEQWQAVMAGRGEEPGSGRSEARELHERIRSMVSSGDPDAAAIGELVIEAHGLMEAARAEREALHAELMSILTPEQRDRFEALQELRPERGQRGLRGRRARP